MDILLFLPVLLLSVVLHEVAHGWVALRQGDDTALRGGRLTLNPIPHLDLVGSLLIPALLWFAPGNVLFGWAKPVPVDPRRFRDPRKGDILVSLAGIAANLVLAALFTVLVVVMVHVGRLVPALSAPVDVAVYMAQLGILLNLILAFFNLIPLPPLDGSHVVYQLLPPELGARYRSVGRYGLLVLMAVVFLAPGAINLLLWPAFAGMQLVRSFIGLLV